MTASEATRAPVEKPTGCAQTEAAILEELRPVESTTIRRLRSRIACPETQLRAALAGLQARDQIAVQTGLYRVRIALTEGRR